MMRLEQLAAGGRDRLVPAMRRVLDDLHDREGMLVWSRMLDADCWTSTTTARAPAVPMVLPIRPDAPDILAAWDRLVARRAAKRVLARL